MVDAEALALFASVREQLRHWAAAEKVAAQGDYVAAVEYNLLQTMSPEAMAEYASGSGVELDNKMRALHSSSALVCNVFDYWRTNDMQVLQNALDLPSQCTLTFEKKLSTGVRGGKANLDILIILADESVVGVECKFLEPYSPRKRQGAFSESYFRGRRRWADVDLPWSQAVAENIFAGALTFRYLDAVQLLKHALALARAYRNRFSLWYFWYEVSSPLEMVHQEEIQRFMELVGSEVRFRAVSYQELHAKLSSVAAADHSRYLAYIGNRYAMV